MINWLKKASKDSVWEEFVEKTAVEKGVIFSTVLEKLKEVFPRIKDKEKAFEYAISGLDVIEKAQRDIMEFLNMNVDYLEEVGVWK